MFRLIAVSLIVGSVCAFWGADSDNYGDFSMNSYKDYDDNDGRYNGLGNRFYDDNDNDSYRNRFLMAGFGRRQRWQQTRRQQSRTRFNPASRRSSRSQGKFSWGSFQCQLQQHPVQTQSRQTTQTRFQSQHGFFGGKMFYDLDFLEY